MHGGSDVGWQRRGSCRARLVGEAVTSRQQQMASVNHRCHRVPLPTEVAI